MNKSYRERLKTLQRVQIQGGSYETAAEIWRATEEIADTFKHDGVRVDADLSDGDIRDAIVDWHAVRKAGL